MEVKSESEVAQSCPSPRDPWTAAHQAPPSMGFSRQEYQTGLPLPSTGDERENLGKINFEIGEGFLKDRKLEAIVKSLIDLTT